MADRQQVSNRELLDSIGEDFADDPDVTMGTMFRSPGLRVGGKIFAFLGRRSGDRGDLIVKLPHDRGSEFVADGVAEQVVMGGRTMREWFVFGAAEDRAATLSRWRTVAREAHQYVNGLRQST